MSFADQGRRKRGL